MSTNEVMESPRKRLKIADDSQDEIPTPQIVAPPPQVLPEQNSAGQLAVPAEDAQAAKEVEVGITDFVNSGIPGFSGILKKRYTDFLVNEILPSGEVLHLQSLAAPPSSAKSAEHGSQNAEQHAQAGPDPAESKPEDNSAEKEAILEEKEAPKAVEPAQPAEFRISDEDNALLQSFFGETIANAIIDLHKRALASPKTKPSDLGRVKSEAITDRDLRTKIHQTIRRVFASQLESSTDNEGMMVISAAPGRAKAQANQGGRGGQGARGPGGQRPRGRLGWDELGGEYLHFTIFKENKDTMEVISYLARQMKMNPKHFQFAGTKDRRGATVQRACVYRTYAERLAGMNRSLRNAVLGDFKYERYGLQLGDLGGNEFVITLRDCQFPGIQGTNDEAVTQASQLVSDALRSLCEKGYFNYYGLQRFGTFTTRTDAVGIKMLQGDFKAAVDAILQFSPKTLAAAQAPSEEDSKWLISTDDKARAQAIHTFQTTGRINSALEILPRKFSAESSIIKHLGRNKNDHFGALQSIPRNLRLMYVHAYQSLVWNYAVGERSRLYGNEVVEGDLVLVNEHKDKDEAPTGPEDVDADGEVIILPGAGDSATATDDMFTRARALTADEAASGKYTMFDVVLPLPGFDILYPANAMTDFYKRFMGSEQGGGLDPFDMRRKWKDISLSGSYRKVLSRPSPTYSFEVKKYSEDDQQFVETDLERVKGGKKEETGRADGSAQDKLTVILKIQLGSSQYATMALRELMKTGGVKTYKPDFGGGR